MSAGGRRPARLFVERIAQAGQVQLLPKVALAHARVLRLAPGARVELFDGEGGCADAELLPPDGRGQGARVGEHRALPPPPVQLTLVACLPKGNRLDTVVRMITELGVAEVRLATSERTVPTPGDAGARLQRLQRIAREACAQSGQPHAPRIEAPRPLPEVASDAPADATRLVFWEQATDPLPTLPRALPVGEAAPTPLRLWAVVGPEGGLSVAEVEALRGDGYRPVGLGRAILRVDTALVAISTMLLDRLGGLA